MVIASYDAQIHVLNLMAATWFSQQAFTRLFKEAELASSTEYATCAARGSCPKNSDEGHAFVILKPYGEAYIL